jgi:hypothetical protein
MMSFVELEKVMTLQMAKVTKKAEVKDYMSFYQKSPVVVERLHHQHQIPQQTDQ